MIHKLVFCLYLNAINLNYFQQMESWDKKDKKTKDNLIVPMQVQLFVFGSKSMNLSVNYAGMFTHRLS